MRKLCFVLNTIKASAKLHVNDFCCQNDPFLDKQLELYDKRQFFTVTPAFRPVCTPQ